MEIASTYIKAQQPKTTDIPNTAVAAEGNDVSSAIKDSGAPPAPLPQAALLTETLQLNGLKPSAENIQMLMHMLDAGIPLTAKNIAHMNQAFKMTQNLEKALFLFQNDIPATSKNTSLLNTLSEGQSQITQQINSLLESISLLKDTALKDMLIKLLDSLSLEKQPSNGEKNVDSNKAQDAQGDINANKSLVPEKATSQAMPIKSAFASVKSPAAIAAFAESASAAVHAAPSHKAPVQINKEIPIISQKNFAATQSAVQSASLSQVAAQAIPVTKAAQAYNAFQSETTAFMQELQEQQGSQELPEAQLKGKGTQTTSASPTLAPSSNASGVAQSVPIQNEATTQALPLSEPSLLKATSEQASLPQSEQGNSANTLPESTVLSELQKKLSLPLENSTIQNMEDFVNNLRDVLAQATLAAEQSQNDPATSRVLRDIRALTEQMDFTHQIKNQIYVQVPLTINDQTFNTALFVNKDGKGGQKNKKDSGSALVALDTAFLGHFETYVQKEKQAVHCQFKLENEDIEQLVRANIHKLDEQLKEYRYSLESFTFIINDQPFTVLDSLKEEKSLNMDKNIRRSDTVFDAMA